MPWAIPACCNQNQIWNKVLSGFTSTGYVVTTYNTTQAEMVQLILHLNFLFFYVCFSFVCSFFSSKSTSHNHCFQFCANKLILSCPSLSLSSLTFPNSLFHNPSGPSSLEWRIVWTDWMMQSLFWGTMQWAPPPVCPVTYTAYWDRLRTGQ